MNVDPRQLTAHLQGELKSVYLVCGSEDLLVLEAADQIRQAAKAKGFGDREIFTVLGGFSWQDLSGQTANMSLFSSRRVLDVRLPGGKPGREGGEWFRQFAKDPGDDILLLTTTHLVKNQLNSAWVKALTGIGVLVQCWPVESQDLPAWLNQRMCARGLVPDADAARLLAERVEGNLLAAAQEVDKLVVLKGSGPVSQDDIQQLVADSSRFDIFRLVEAALTGQGERALRMSHALRAEGIAPILVLWAFSKEIRLLCQMRQLLNDGGNIDGFLNRSGVWAKRKKVLQQAMRRCSLAFWERALLACSRLDRMIKGQENDDPWMAIERLAVKVAAAGRR
jgi:DNA polymerase-3 subunit delta